MPNSLEQLNTAPQPPGSLSRRAGPARVTRRSPHPRDQRTSAHHANRAPRGGACSPVPARALGPALAPRPPRARSPPRRPARPHPSPRPRAPARPPRARPRPRARTHFARAHIQTTRSTSPFQGPQRGGHLPCAYQLGNGPVIHKPVAAVGTLTQAAPCAKRKTITCCNRHKLTRAGLFYAAISTGLAARATSPVADGTTTVTVSFMAISPLG